MDTTDMKGAISTRSWHQLYRGGKTGLLVRFNLRFIYNEHFSEKKTRRRKVWRELDASLTYITEDQRRDVAYCRSRSARDRSSRITRANLLIPLPSPTRILPKRCS